MLENESDLVMSGVKVKTVPGAVFVIAGLLFLFAALALFSVTGFLLYSIGARGPIIEGETQRMIGSLLTFFTAPLAILIAAIFCTIVGIHLLKAAGIVTQHVIPPHDYELLASAIQAGNGQAISEYVRLSSLSGMTGTFTKLGLTGLPLATIALTIFLAALGLVVPKFFDLAQLTLGAFIGSYVEKRHEASSSKQKRDHIDPNS